MNRLKAQVPFASVDTYTSDIDNRASSLMKDCNRNIFLVLFFILGLLSVYPAAFFFRLGYPYLAYFALLVGFLLVVKSLNIQNIAIGTSGVALSLLKETKEVQRDLKTMLHILLPLIARSGLSESTANLLPNRGRIYIYNLIQQIYADNSLSDSEKTELTEELKWVMLKFLFTRMQYELEQLGIANEITFKEKVQPIKNKLKHILDQNEYKISWLINQIRNLNHVDITQILGEKDIEYSKILNDYIKIIERFSEDNTIDSTLLKTGQRKDLQ